MKKNKYVLSATVVFISLFAGLQAIAQSDVSAIIKSGREDATKLTNAYLSPLFKGLGTGLNSGWNNTAHSKNLLRFELRFGLTGVIIPKKDDVFDVTKIGLSNHIRPSDPSKVLTPTVAGSKTPGPQVDIYDDNNKKIETFTLPQGSNLPFVPAPQLQGTIGLPKGIDFTLRAMPKVNLGSKFGSLGMFGAGVKVELLPLIAGKTVDKIFPLDVAAALGYTQFNYKLPVNVQPGNAQPKDAQQNTDFSNQSVDAKFSGINMEIILSKKFLVFTPFLSVGYNTARTNVTLKGNYPIVTDNDIVTGEKYTTFTDPVSIKQNDVSGLRTNLGFQFSLAFFRIYGSYSIANYNSFNAGLGFGLGK